MIDDAHATVYGQEYLCAKALTRIEKLTPHNRKNLPPEIMSEIFVWCMKMDGSIITLPPSYTHPIWNITQVCSSWRMVAMVEPFLWRRLHITPTPKLEALNHLIRDICLNRGGPGMIECDACISCPEELQDYFDLVSNYPLRLRTQHITFKNFSASTIASYILPGHVESISINTLKSRHPLFVAGYGLRKATISPARSIRRVSLPWDQLTHLTTHPISFIELADLLRCSTHLTHCKFQVTPDDWRGTVALRGPICLDDLHTITIAEESDYSATLEIVALLVVPNLKKLQFLNRDIDWWGGLSSSHFHQTILELISRSTCTLEIFEAPHWIKADAIVPLMRAMPQLTNLVAFTRDSVSESILDTIIAEDLCQRLCDLRGWKVEPTLCSFIAFWNSRWGVHTGDFAMSIYEQPQVWILPGFSTRIGAGRVNDMVHRILLPESQH